MSDASLSFRYEYLPSEIEGYEEMITKQLTKNLGESKHKNSRDLIFRTGEDIKKNVVKYANRVNALTHALQSELQTAIVGMTPEQVQRFKLDSRILIELMNEFTSAKDVGHVLAVVKAYNQGSFDQLFPKPATQSNQNTNEKQENTGAEVERPAAKADDPGSDSEEHN